MKILSVLLSIIVSITLVAQTYTDKPYLQDYADKYELGENQSIELQQVRSDRNKSISVLSVDGLLQPWEKSLVEDMRYRPLKDLKIISIESYDDQFIYLTNEAVFSYAWAGKEYLKHNIQNVTHFKVGHDFTVLLAAENKLALFQNGEKVWEESIENFSPQKLVFDLKGKRFLALSDNAIYMLKCPEQELSKIYTGENLTTMALTDEKIVVGTSDGIFDLDLETFSASTINKKLPNTEINCVAEINGKLWFGSGYGAFSLREDGKYDYYASERWLVDNRVKDISKGPKGSILVLTENGLSKINFKEMTLADKAEYFQDVQRLRHIRYGFSSYLGLKEKGDLSTGFYRDTDNDGLWTSMYLAGEIFRYAVTKSEDAKLNAYEAFEAMERLTEISGIPGFPARTYEIDSYQSSDTDPNMPEDEKIWRLTEDERWRWKSTTSSDESCGHFFVYALFAELMPDKEWRDRAIHQLKIEMDHLIDNDWYLKTWNGEITEWGRWNPEYVNKFSIHTGDRRLNSSLILAFLQATYHFTGEEIYKEKAYELMKDHGYDKNAMLPATVIGLVDGEDLSDTWNHSDDEMYFLTIPNLVNYAFNEEIRQKYFEASKSHWEIERSEKNPLWNYMYAMIGGKDYDSMESAWWLREFPLDLISWNVNNSHRKDLVRIEENFRRQEYTEVLPRDERPMHLHNNAYRNDANEGGKREYPPYLYLLPYWAGRYVDAISAPIGK